MPEFRVQAIDHVEMFVPDQRQAADWYARVLGLEILPDYVHWATDGPLMISSDGGRTKLALFRGRPPEDRPLAGFRRVAFRVEAEDFARFLDHAERLELRSESGRLIRRGDVVDHGLARSIYFCDPWGHRLEVTAYSRRPNPENEK